MKALLAIALLGGLVPAQTQAADELKSVQVITPVFHQLVAFSLPTVFTLNAPEQQNQKFYLHEIVLRGQTVDQWTQMITLKGERGAAAGNSPQSALTLAATEFQNVCPESFAFKDLGKLNIAGAPASGGVISCGHVKDEQGAPGAFHSETALYLAIAGDQDAYSLQWAERGAASMKPMVVDQAKWAARLQTLGPIRVCRKVPGEQAPYPSCLSH